MQEYLQRQAVDDIRRIAVALEALAKLAVWFTSGDTTTLDRLCNEVDLLKTAHEAVFARPEAS